MTGQKVRLGIVGIGGAAVNMLPAFTRNPHLVLTAVADLDTEILERFQSDYRQVETFTSVEDISATANVDLIYIATPSVLHGAHAAAALEGGKHVLIEKPMAVSLEEADTMITTAEANGVLLGVNVKHSFEPRIQKLREFVLSGELGQLRMVNTWRYVDWLYRPRTQEELTPGWGSGILWRQGPHQIDLVRTICGGLLKSIRGSCQIFDPARRVAGAYTGFLEFENGVIANVLCSGYDHFDSQAMVYGFNGDEPLADPAKYAKARRELHSHADEPGWEDHAAASERYGGGRKDGGASGGAGLRGGWLLGGPLIASFDHADVRLSQTGLIVDGNDGQREIDLNPGWDGRDGRLTNFCQAIADGTPLAADGRWGKATQEALVAFEQSSESRSEVALSFQTPTVEAAVDMAQAAE